MNEKDSIIGDQSRNKAELRREVKARLRQVSDARLAQSLSQVIEHLKEGLVDLGEADCVGLFGGLRGEPDLVKDLGPWLRGRGVATAVFSFGPDGMIPRNVVSEADVQRGSLGVWEPVQARAPSLSPHALTVVLVPGMAFSKSGERLGRGGGYYDRLLNSVGSKARIIGVTIDSLLEDALPMEPHDQRVQEIVTETGWLPCR